MGIVREPHPENFTICPTCYRLQGRVSHVQPGGDHPALEQSCACARAEGRRSGIVPARWPGFDFNEVWTLCYSCGAALLESGSRWSVWFCEHCKERVRRLHQVCGAYVIPCGRHSMMAGFGVARGGPLALKRSPSPRRSSDRRLRRRSQGALWAHGPSRRLGRAGGRPESSATRTRGDRARRIGAVSRRPCGAARGPAAAIRRARPPLRSAGDTTPARGGAVIPGPARRTRCGHLRADGDEHGTRWLGEMSLAMCRLVSRPATMPGLCPFYRLGIGRTGVNERRARR